MPNSIDFERSIKTLSNLPYKRGKFASRYWGHKYHFFVSYPSKLKPSIAHFLIKLFSKQTDVVLDPFSGVGTIPFEACANGRFGIGSDINPIAYHATKAKVNPPSYQALTKQLSSLQNYIKKQKCNVGMREVEKEIIPYYHSETLKEIIAARKYFIDRLTSNNSFLLSCMLHILHGNRPYALSRRSHNIIPWPPRGKFIYKSVMASLTEKAYRMIRAELPLGFKRGRALQDNVFNLGFDNNAIDSIITSPPFYSNRDFLRMNRIRLWFCGWSYGKQKEMRSVFLEHHKDIKIYRNVFREFYRVLKPKSPCVIHLGVVKTFDMAINLRPYAEEAGFVFLTTIYEDASKLESHGIVDRGATKRHQFLILKKS